MKNAITILGAVLLTAASVQMASAGQRENDRKIDRSQASKSQQFRDSNAYYNAQDLRPQRGDDFRYSYDRLDSLYPGGAISAPAGR